MPIRPDLRHFYSTPEYKAQREKIVKRSGNACENCSRPNGVKVRVRSGKGRMFWSANRRFAHWTNDRGWRITQREDFEVAINLKERLVKTVCTMAHLNHDPADNSDENTKFLCQWCHLWHDRSHHRETRCTRKDRDRELLAVGVAS